MRLDRLLGAVVAAVLLTGSLGLPAVGASAGSRVPAPAAGPPARSTGLPAGATGATGIPAAAAAVADPGSSYVPVPTLRVAAGEVVGPRGTLVLDLPRRGLTLPPAATAVSVNVTVAGVSARTFVSLCPGGTAVDECRRSSTLNPYPGRDTANHAVVALGREGTSAQAVLVHNDTGSVRVFVDVLGYHVPSGASTDATAGAAPLSFVARGPARDDETPVLGAAATATVTLDDVPLGAEAVAVRATATTPTSTYVSVCPGGTARDVCRRTSTLNPPGSRDTSNLTVVPLGGPEGDAVTVYNDRGTTRVLLDVVGFYLPAGASSSLVVQAPRRVLSAAAAGPRGTVRLRVPDLPAGASGVVLTVTSAAATSRSFVSVCPGGTAVERCRSSSTSNPYPGSDLASTTVVGLGPDGDVLLHNDAGSLLLFVDVLGYLVGEAPAPPAPGDESRWRLADGVVQVPTAQVVETGGDRLDRVQALAYAVLDESGGAPRLAFGAVVMFGEPTSPDALMGRVSFVHPLRSGRRAYDVRYTPLSDVFDEVYLRWSGPAVGEGTPGTVTLSSARQACWSDTAAASRSTTSVVVEDLDIELEMHAGAEVVRPFLRTALAATTTSRAVTDLAPCTPVPAPTGADVVLGVGALPLHLRLVPGEGTAARGDGSRTVHRSTSVWGGWNGLGLAGRSFHRVQREPWERSTPRPTSYGSRAAVEVRVDLAGVVLATASTEREVSAALLPELGCATTVTDRASADYVRGAAASGLGGTMTYAPPLDAVPQPVDCFGANIDDLVVLQATEWLPPAVHGSPYEAALVAYGGVPPLTWTLEQSEVSWLQVAPSGRLVGGAPVEGRYGVQVRVTDSRGAWKILFLILEVAPAGTTETQVQLLGGQGSRAPARTSGNGRHVAWTAPVDPGQFSGPMTVARLDRTTSVTEQLAPAGWELDAVGDDGTLMVGQALNVVGLWRASGPLVVLDGAHQEAALSPDGRHVALCTRHPFASQDRVDDSWPGDMDVYVYDVASGTARWVGAQPNCLGIAVADGGSTVATLDYGLVRRVDVATGVVQRSVALDGALYLAQLTRDGRTALLSRGPSQAGAVVDLVDGRSASTVVAAGRLSSDGSRMVTNRWAHPDVPSVQVVDPWTGALLTVLPQGTGVGDPSSASDDLSSIVVGRHLLTWQP